MYLCKGYYADNNLIYSHLLYNIEVYFEPKSLTIGWGRCYYYRVSTTLGAFLICASALNFLTSGNGTRPKGPGRCDLNIDMRITSLEMAYFTTHNRFGDACFRNGGDR